MPIYRNRIDFYYETYTFKLHLINLIKPRGKEINMIINLRII